MQKVFTISALLGLRLLGMKQALRQYESKLSQLALRSLVLTELTKQFPGYFSTFSALFERVRMARNDAMHTGVFARHATAAAIDLCIGLEEGLMSTQATTVKDVMVKSTITVEPWQPVALARQLMLTHSFSFLPVKIEDRWKLISESALAKYLQLNNKTTALAKAIKDAAEQKNGLTLSDANIVTLDEKIRELIQNCPSDGTQLWLVEDPPGHLCGVLSPFELM